MTFPRSLGALAWCRRSPRLAPAPPSGGMRPSSGPQDRLAAGDRRPASTTPSGTKRPPSFWSGRSSPTSAGRPASGRWSPTWPTTPRLISPSSAMTGSRIRSRRPSPAGTPPAPDDFICINLDSFNDRQSLYAFYVNPLGIQTRQPLRQRQRGFQRSTSSGRARGGSIPTATASSHVPLQEPLLMPPARPVSDVHLFRAPHLRRSEHSSHPAPTCQGLRLPDPDDAARARKTSNSIPGSSSRRPTLIRTARNGWMAEWPAGLGVHDGHLTGSAASPSRLILDGTYNRTVSQVDGTPARSTSTFHTTFFPREEALLP